ncbi:MAG: hypothetical protein IKD68_00255, partial [Solobacterium sp.]|nr:hypothetical protein [Solobacterium sp.]
MSLESSGLSPWAFSSASFPCVTVFLQNPFFSGNLPPACQKKDRRKRIMPKSDIQKEPVTRDEREHKDRFFRYL